eukprot:7112023-Alexandrium_andersonii.AAC.1
MPARTVLTPPPGGLGQRQGVSIVHAGIVWASGATVAWGRSWGIVWGGGLTTVWGEGWSLHGQEEVIVWGGGGP